MLIDVHYVDKLPVCCVRTSNKFNRHRPVNRQDWMVSIPFLQVMARGYKYGQWLCIKFVRGAYVATSELGAGHCQCIRVYVRRWRQCGGGPSVLGSR